MSHEHYFSADPSAPAKLTELEIEVGGEVLQLSASSGTFSSERLDPGTRVLLGLQELFPTDGIVLDLGCGWGPIGLSIAKLQPATQVIGVDVNQRSVELANSNAKRNGLENFTAFLDRDLDPNLDIDHIWSNPPIRIGKENLHDLLRTYMSRLNPTGDAYLVVQKQLGAESLQRWIAQQWPEREVTKVENSKGFRVIRIR
ncbi:MAG: methyltransferase [Aquiluna sp.]|jgi:16S rRNA (guanine1207-N2)-methyltransferase